MCMVQEETWKERVIDDAVVHNSINLSYRCRGFELSHLLMPAKK